MTYFQLFGISIPALWIAFLAAAFLLSLKLDGWFSNAIVIYVIIWKLSYILFYWESILGLLYFNGGIKGHWLGLFVATIYIILLAPKNTLPSKDKPSVLHCSIFTLSKQFLIYYRATFYSR